MGPDALRAWYWPPANAVSSSSRVLSVSAASSSHWAVCTSTFRRRRCRKFYRRHITASATHLKRRASLFVDKAAVTTTIRLRYYARSTAIRLLIRGHWVHSDVTHKPQSSLFMYLGCSAAHRWAFGREVWSSNIRNTVESESNRRCNHRLIGGTWLPAPKAAGPLCLWTG